MAYPANDHERIVSALTEWDRRQARRDKHHNPRFLGIALLALADVEADTPEADARTIATAALDGRCLDFVLKAIAAA